jgi:hypothetical protein
MCLGIINFGNSDKGNHVLLQFSSETFFFPSALSKHEFKGGIKPSFSLSCVVFFICTYVICIEGRPSCEGALEENARENAGT